MNNNSVIDDLGISESKFVAYSKSYFVNLHFINYMFRSD